MRRPDWARVAFALLVSPLVALGCGGTSGSTKPARVLDERQYVRQVDAICNRSAQALKGASSLDAAEVAERLREAIQVIDEDLAQVGRLRPPAGIAVHIERAVAFAREARAIYSEARREAMLLPDQHAEVSPADAVWRQFERGNDAESKAAVSWAVAGVDPLCAPLV